MLLKGGGLIDGWMDDGVVISRHGGCPIATD